MSFIPPIGTTGLWSIITPFDNLLTNDVAYELIATRKLSEIVLAGEDPHLLYYAPHDLMVGEYETDLGNDVSILSLQGKGAVHHVPSSYLLSFPDIGGIPYYVMGATIDLGALPAAFDKNNLVTELTNLITENTGILPTVKIVNLSTKTLIANATHEALEVTRNTNITNSSTDRARRIEAEQNLAIAQTKIAELEAYIIQLKNDGVI